MNIDKDKTVPNSGVGACDVITLVKLYRPSDVLWFLEALYLRQFWFTWQKKKYGFNIFFIPPSRKGYFCSSISDRKSRFYPQVSKSRFYPLVNKVNLNLEHRMNKRVAAVMAAGDRNSWSLAVVPTWRSKVVEETNSIFKIWCGTQVGKQSTLLGCKAALPWANLNPSLH